MSYVAGMWSTGRIAKLRELWPRAWSGKVLAAELNKLPGPPVNPKGVMRMARTLALEITTAHAARSIGPRVTRVGSAAYGPQFTEVDCRGQNVLGDDTFCATMRAAIDRGDECAPFGIAMSDSDIRTACRFIPVAPSSYVGSPAAACAES